MDMHDKAITLELFEFETSFSLGSSFLRERKSGVFVHPAASRHWMARLRLLETPPAWE
jgi:hypothetical protein